jgi:BirA family biotin operon repressor/biotin-[acetyl-CoA-carboxylase] ligase
VGFVRKHVEVIDSTNVALWSESEQRELPDFYCLTAGFQSKGMGQDANLWESEKNQNILMSTLVHPHFLLAEDAFQISRWVALSVFRYLQAKGLEDIKIKWPNDIYVGKKKIAGILIQNAMAGSYLSKSMIGVGINVNQTNFLSDAPNPVSLKHLTNTHYQLSDEINMLMESLQLVYQELQQQPQMILERYLKHLYQKDVFCTYQIAVAQIKGKIKGVDQFGRLLLESPNGNIDVFDIKEIRFL